MNRAREDPLRRFELKNKPRQPFKALGAQIVTGYATAIGLIVVMLLLTGCLPSAGIARFEAAEAVVENEIDAVVAFAVDRLCQLKIDIMARAAARNADMARAMYYACPDVRGLVMTTLQAIGSDGFKVEVQITNE